MTSLFTSGSAILPKSFSEIREGIVNELKDKISPNINFQSTSFMGQLVNVVADSARQYWEAASRIYFNSYIGTAEGSDLANLALITGTEKRRGTRALCDITMSLDAGTIVPQGSLVQNVSASYQWRTTEEIENTTTGSANFFTTVESLQTGSQPFVAAGRLTTIATPVVGWSSVTNGLDSGPGQDPETDQELLERQRAELFLQGRSTFGALFSRVSALDFITTTIIKENIFPTSASNLPPNSFEVSVLFNSETPTSGQITTLRDTIFTSKPAGIQAFGQNIVTNYTSSNGTVHQVGFTEVARKNIYLSVTASTDTGNILNFDDYKAFIVQNFTGSVGQDFVLQKRVVRPSYQFNGNIELVQVTASLDAFPGDGSATEVSTERVVILSDEVANLDTTRIDIAEVQFIDE